MSVLIKFALLCLNFDHFSLIAAMNCRCHCQFLFLNKLYSHLCGVCDVVVLECIQSDFLLCYFFSR